MLLGLDLLPIITMPPRAIFLVLPVLLSGLQLSQGAPACMSCLVGCFETAAVCAGLGPLGATACFVFCEAFCVGVCVSPACFSPGQEIAVLGPNNSTKLLSVGSVQRGDTVLSWENAQPVATEVTHSFAQEGRFEFVNLTATNNRTISVTANHILPVAAGPETGLELRAARSISLGDILLTGDGQRVRIMDIQSYTARRKHTLVTRLGTVIAQGFLVSTICEENLPQPNNGSSKFQSTMDAWRKSHDLQILSYK